MQCFFLHGSSRVLEPGSRLTPRGESYENDWNHTDFYAALERHRPTGHRAHKDSVFLCKTVLEVDYAGGCIDYICLVEPDDLSSITRHDVNWSSRISCLIGDGYSIDSLEVQEAASNYWNGVPHKPEPVWEYLCSGAAIIEISDVDDDNVEQVDQRFDKLCEESHAHCGFIPANDGEALEDEGEPAFCA